MVKEVKFEELYEDDRVPQSLIHMSAALLWATRSTCQRLKVGAVLAKGGRTISTGYNGAPSGLPHCNEDNCKSQPQCKRTVHAEMNAILFAARYGISTEGTELYTTHSPCIDCAKAIINAGIRKVYYIDEYRSQGGIELLKSAGVEVYKIAIKENGGEQECHNEE